eukprot:TRINITY_DN1890_c0_g1_i3.p1 TRINITY_DN1890_c0_g1~~TRINITY_DN1890_c0_g1_i3.p1  ORF type:complete len:271 (+),score=59.69 TRINITY_DN1890_c0_g1_i3:209-1021(+)
MLFLCFSMLIACSVAQFGGIGIAGAGFGSSGAAATNNAFAEGLATGFRQDAGQAAAVNQAIDYRSAAAQNVDAYNCASYICVEFADSHASGFNSASSFQEAGASQFGDAAASQFAAASGVGDQFAATSAREAASGIEYEVPIFPFYGVGYGYGAGAGYGAAASQNFGNAAANAASYAQRVGASQFANANNAYVSDNHAIAAAGKTCKQYVCSSTLAVESLQQVGNQAGSAAASQFGNGAAAQNGFGAARQTGFEGGSTGFGQGIGGGGFI